MKPKERLLWAATGSFFIAVPSVYRAAVCFATGHENVGVVCLRVTVGLVLLYLYLVFCMFKDDFIEQAISPFILSVCFCLLVPSYLHIQAMAKRLDSALCRNLCAAAEAGANEEVSKLLQEGANPNCQSGEPLHRALKQGYEDTAALLRQAGAKR